MTQHVEIALLRDPALWIHGQQPVGPVKMDGNNSDIAFAYIATFDKDLVTGITPTKLSTTNFRVSNGIRTVQTDTNYALNWPDLRPIAATGNGYTFLIVSNPIFKVGVDRVLTLGDEAAAAFNQVSVAFNTDLNGASAPGNFVTFEYDTGFKSKGVDAAGLSSGDTVPVFHVWAVSRATGTVALKIFKDGVVTTTTSVAGAGITMTDGVMINGSPGDSARVNPADVSLLLIFKRELSETEVLSYSLDPYQFLIPA